MHQHPRVVRLRPVVRRTVGLTACSWLFALVATLGVRPASAAPVVPANFYLEDATFGAALEVPVALAFLPDGRWLVAEKAGRVSVMQDGFQMPTPLVDLTAEVLNNGDRGLLGLAVDPQFETQRYVYLMYTVDPDSDSVDDDDDAYGRLVRYEVGMEEPLTVVPSSRTILFGTTWSDGPPSGSSSHAVGDLAFGADGTLLVSIGDGAQIGGADAGGADPGMFRNDHCDPAEDIGAFRAQSLSSLDGKVLRIDPRTGAGVPSNPFFDGNPMSKRSRVWASGLRNPFRIAVRPGTGSADPNAGNPGALLIGDVGWMSWEEVDLATEGGRNFGWPCYEGAQPNLPYQNALPAHHGCSSFGTPEIPSPHQPPLLVWHHADSTLGNPAGFNGNCVIGGAFYAGTRYPFAYQGAYFFADFGRSRIRVATLDAAGALGAVSDFASNCDYPVGIEFEPSTGDLLFISVATNKIWRVRYNLPSTNRKPFARVSISPGSGLAPLAVQLSSAGTWDPDGDALALTWRFGDGQTSTEISPLHTYSNPGSYAATLTVTDGRGGVARDTAYIAVARTFTFPSASVLDGFQQMDGPISNGWSGDMAGYAVTSGRLVPTGSTPGVVLWNTTAYGVHQEAFMKIATVGGGDHVLVLDAQGLNVSPPRIEVRWNANSGRAAVVTTDGFNETTWGDPIAITLASGDVLGARVFANGDVEIYANSARRATRSVAGWPWLRRGGFIGLRLANTASARLDDFGGGDIALDPNTSPAASIQLPVEGSFVAEGDVIQLAGTGADAQDPVSALTYRWEIDLLHNNHVHPSIYTFETASASFAIDNHEDGTGTSYFGRFIVADHSGLRDTATVRFFPDVNLTPTAVLSPDTALVGTSLALSFRIHNLGRMPTARSHWVLRTGATVIAQGDTLVHEQDSVTVAVAWTAPATAGTYPLTAEVDATGLLHETREDDNTATRSLVAVVPVLPTTFPATPIVDSFNRANGPLGASWSGDVASATVNANQYRPTSSALIGTVWNAAGFGSDQEAYVRLSALTASSPRHGVLLKVQGATYTTGAIEVRYDASTKQKKIYVSTYQPGTGWQSRGNFSATFAAMDVLGARAKANGDVEVYRNGSKIGTVNVAAWSFASAGGRIGVTLEKAASSLLDDFGGGTVVGGPPPANHLPIAAATATPASGTAPLAVTFSSAGTSDPNGDPLTYAWAFGNGQTSSSANPSTSYSTAGTFVATLTVSDGRGGSAIARDTIVVTAPPPSASFPATPVVDDFNRPDGAIGGAWTGTLAGLTVTANELKCASTAYLGTVWNGAVFGATQEAYVRISALTASATRQGLLLKVQGTTVTSGAIEVRYDASSKQKKIIVATCTNGTWTNRGSAISVTLSRGDVLGARAKANGDVEVYRNGAQIGTVSVSAWAYATAGGRIGVTLEKASSTKLDNFGGGTIAVGGAEPVALSSAESESGRVPPPTRLALSEAWPNPARESAEFALELPHGAKVRTQVFDLQGRTVWSETTAYGAGHWTLRWRPEASRSRVRAGVYFARIDVGGTRFERRVILAP